MNASRNLVVLDTNLIISAFILPNSIAAQALEIGLEYFDPVCSKEVLYELLDVIKRDKFAKYATKQELTERLNLYTQAVIFMDVVMEVTDCKDPKDNKFLSLALTSGAKLIVSGDKKDLICMNPYKGVDILRLREFMENFQKYR
jgi:putative PIN family toxin of toxin-antitoxin system